MYIAALTQDVGFFSVYRTEFEKQLCFYGALFRKIYTVLLFRFSSKGGQLFGFTGFFQKSLPVPIKVGFCIQSRKHTPKFSHTATSLYFSKKLSSR